MIFADPDASRAESSAPTPAASFVVFRLARVWYAFPAIEVKEIVPRTTPVPVPQTPGFVLGVTNVSGRIVVLLDLKTLLGMNAREEPQDEVPLRDLVLLADGLPMGARVDEVSGLIEVPTTEVQPIAAEDKSAAVATFTREGRAVSVLNVARVAALAEARVGTG